MSKSDLSWHRHPLISVLVASSLGLAGFLGGRATSRINSALINSSPPDYFVEPIALIDTHYGAVPVFESRNTQGNWIKTYSVEWVPVSLRISNHHPTDDLMIDTLVVAATAQIGKAAVSPEYIALPYGGGVDKESYEFAYFALPDINGEWNILRRRRNAQQYCVVPDHLVASYEFARPEIVDSVDSPDSPSDRLSQLSATRYLVSPGESAYIDFVIDAAKLGIGDRCNVSLRIGGLLGSDYFDMPVLQYRIRTNAALPDNEGFSSASPILEEEGMVRFCRPYLGN